MFHDQRVAATQEDQMSHHANAADRLNGPVAVAIPTISVRQILPWLLFAAMLALVGLYFVSAEEGATSLIAGNAVHEWVHDSRHLLGFPCH
jgi:putative cobalt transporter subunit CbtB